MIDPFVDSFVDPFAAVEKQVVILAEFVHVKALFVMAFVSWDHTLVFVVNTYQVMVDKNFGN